MIPLADGPWSLPGPAREVAELCNALYEQRVVAVRVPLGGSTLAYAMQQRLNDHGQVHVHMVEACLGRSTVMAIAQSIGISAKNAAALVTAPELNDCAVILEMSRGQGDVFEPNHELNDLARFAPLSPTGSKPLILIIGDGHLPPIAGKRPREMRGVVGPLDAASRLAQHTIELGHFEHRLVTSIAMETAGWDIEVLDRLATLPIAQAIRPDQCVEAWADSRFHAWGGVQANWTTGTIDNWAGESCEHPLWLAANQPPRLMKRVWRGQVAVLLPWIETRRLETIARFRKNLRPDPDRSGPNLESLDWGPLRSQLNWVPNGLIDFLESHRVARNELAHGRPLRWPEIAKCLSSARRWSICD